MSIPIGKGDEQGEQGGMCSKMQGKDEETTKVEEGRDSK